MCAGGFVCNESDDSFVHSNQWLDVGFCGVICTPDADVEDEMWVYVCKI